MKISLKPILYTSLFLISIAMFAFTFVLKNESETMEKQEQASAIVAEEYLSHVYDTNNTQSTTNSPSQPKKEFEYIDNKIFGKYKENWAQGQVDMVLEIPKIEFRQSIFKGTSEQIEHDLSIWLATSSLTNYELGKTRYCIYIHNPTNKSISISRAQEELKANDYLVATKGDKVYLYQINNVYPQWRNESMKIVNDDTIPKEKLYIFTCGLGEWLGRNMTIEGTMYKTYNILDWNKNKDKYIEEYKNTISPPPKKETRTMNVETKDDKVIVSLSSKEGDIVISDMEGKIVKEIAYQNTPLTLPSLAPNEYLVGIKDNDKYEPITPKKLVVSKQSHVKITNLPPITTKEDDILGRMIARGSCLLLAFVSLYFLLSFIFTTSRKKD